MNCSSQMFKMFFLTLILYCFTGCQKESIDNSGDGPLFINIPVSESQLNFKNELRESNQFNFINYIFIFNGGGVCIGDINNDGLKDIYFSSNQGSNRLYLNKGKMKFEDVTRSYGVADADGWTTGINMIDINADGWLDIYVCKSGNLPPEQRQNKLFINQNGERFIESAVSWGLNDPAWSNQSYFLDYDKDGDLDMYLVNHRNDWNNTTLYDVANEAKRDIYTTDKLFRNDGNRFTDVTVSAGVSNKTWGHSAAVADFNDDGWPDIYVCNDFLQGDNLWINNGDGSFTDKILEYFDHTSFFSMGSDVADINNDHRPDLVVLDMVSEDHVSNKKLMAGMSTEQFRNLVNLGNHYQYMTNILQLNRGQGQYSEIAYTAGIANTDWSWAPLIADFDNDGFKDIFITNGIKRDMTDNDFKISLEKRAQLGPMNIEDVYEMIPSRKIQNYFFRNLGNTRFDNLSEQWGLDQNINSNGAAWGDLDNDGDLDLVVNNLDDYASLYENQGSGNKLVVKLKGPDSNPMGLGSELIVKSNDDFLYQQHYTARGYLSTVDPDMYVGLGDMSTVSEVQMVWPDGKSEILTNVKANTTISFDYRNATIDYKKPEYKNTLLATGESAPGLSGFSPEEDSYDDFVREILLPQKYSSQGPYSSTADVNGDGLDDIFISGSRDKPARLFIQDTNGNFKTHSENTWQKDRMHEDLGSVFFDVDNDGDQDLYVVSGGNEYPENHEYYIDRLYINDGTGNFSRSKSLPEIRTSGYCVVKADYDKDGDDDLFVGGRIVPGKYPLPTSSHILRNDSGKLVIATRDIAEDLVDIGMVTSALWSDYDVDGDLDLMISGEWLGLIAMENQDGKFKKKELSEISGRGWYFALAEADFNGDNRPDYLMGNLGLNNKFGAKENKPFHVFCNDFDRSGNLDIVLSKEKKGTLLPVRGRECSSQQMPFIKDKFPTYASFAESDLLDIYGEENINSSVHYEVNNFASIVLLSTTDGSFVKKELPIEAQYGPSLSFQVLDVNRDGKLDIIGAGNIYDAEVETVRYDANKGYVLLGDGQGGFEYVSNSGFIVDGDVRQLNVAEINKQKQLIVVRNSESIKLYNFLM